jgi:hypothetical protein
MTDSSSSTKPSPTQMEDYLSSVKDVITEATGEKGLGEKIMSNVQDFMSLDAIKRMLKRFASTNLFFIPCFILSVC